MVLARLLIWRVIGVRVARSSCRRNEAAFDCEAIVRSECVVSLKNRVC